MIFLEFSNIQHSHVMRAATIFLAHEFKFIMKEASEFFAHYKINAGCPPIEEILFNQEEIMRIQSPDFVAYKENLRKRVPTEVLVDKISKLNDKFAIQNNGLGFILGDNLMTFHQRKSYNDELIINYKGPNEELIPPALDLRDPYPIKYSPFDYFCLPQRKISTERREYEMSMDDLPYYYANT